MCQKKAFTLDDYLKAIGRAAISTDSNSVRLNLCAHSVLYLHIQNTQLYIN